MVMKKRSLPVTIVNAEKRNFLHIVRAKYTRANPEDFLTCKNCNRFFHAQCNEPPLNKTIVIQVPNTESQLFISRLIDLIGFAMSVRSAMTASQTKRSIRCSSAIYVTERSTWTASTLL